MMEFCARLLFHHNITTTLYQVHTNTNDAWWYGRGGAGVNTSRCAKHHSGMLYVYIYSVYVLCICFFIVYCKYVVRTYNYVYLHIFTST